MRKWRIRVKAQLEAEHGESKGNCSGLTYLYFPISICSTEQMDEGIGADMEGFQNIGVGHI